MGQKKIPSHIKPMVFITARRLMKDMNLINSLVFALKRI
jgi:hypothetical protein